MRIQSMNRHALIGLTLVSGILTGCQDFLSQDRPEASDLSDAESAQQNVVQEEANTEANASADCAALEAQMQATFGDPLAYGIAKEAWYQACVTTPPPQPADTATQCKGLAATMMDEKSQTLEGYYQPLKLQFDAMNCSQYVGPAPALNLVLAQPAPTPIETKVIPAEPVQPLDEKGDETKTSDQCAALVAQMQATFGDPLAYGIAKEAWYQACWVAPPPQPVDTATLCKDLAAGMVSEKAQTLEGYYQPLKLQFDAMNCSQHFGPAPALSLISTQPAPTPIETKAAPTEPAQPLNQADLCLSLQEAMSSEKAKTDDAYYFQLKTQFGENSCVWISAPVQPTAADTAKACLNFQQALTQMEPGSPKIDLYKAYITEHCSG
jgi:hypothetical protein